MYLTEEMALERTIEYLYKQYEDGEPMAGSLLVWLNALNAYHHMDQRFMEMQTPIPLLEKDDGRLCCPHCQSSLFLYNDDGIENEYCGNCGQALMWREEDFYIDRGEYK